MLSSRQPCSTPAPINNVARTTVDLPESKEEEEDDDTMRPESDIENMRNEKGPGTKKKPHKKDTYGYANQVSKTLGCNRWMRDSILKGGIERLT